MLNNPAARRAVSSIIDPVARGLLALRISPDAVTITGTAATCAVALYFFPRGSFVVGSLIITLLLFSDLLDGTMARMSGRSGPWGNFLDATLDRVTDGFLFGALLIWASTTGNGWTEAAALIALVSGQVISYAKARAEAVGATANVGIAERAERMILALLGAFLTGLGVVWALPIALWILALLGIVTVLQRVIVVRRQLAPRGPDGAGQG